MEPRTGRGHRHPNLNPNLNRNLNPYLNPYLNPDDEKAPLLLIAVKQSPGETPNLSFVIGDHLGYPEMVIDTTGTVTWTADHLPFGQVYAETNPDNDPGLRYPGQWTVPEAEGLGLPEMYYNVFRWYRGGWGRYLQADPIGLQGGVNLFVYVGGNPVGAIDPLGLAYFAKRPLGGGSWCRGLSGGSLDLDTLNVEFSHEQLFFEDGESPSNLGLFDDGEVRPDRQFPGNGLSYRPGLGHLNDCIARMAARAASGGYYNFIGIDVVEIGPRTASGPKYNCQDWASEVRRIYDILAGLPEVREQCGCE
ncbi:MAG: RHS repeat-associated core domain-containing protein [Acidobacteriota bacterium]